MSELFKNKGSSCCVAVGCSMRAGTNFMSEVKMFCFPKNPERRKRWEIAVHRENWTATSSSRLCNRHFITGKPSLDPLHPDYIPSVFGLKTSSVCSENQKIDRYERKLKRVKIDQSILHTNIEGKPAQVHDVNHPDWAPSKNMGYHKTLSQNCVLHEAHEPHIEESDITFVAKVDHPKTTTASLDDNHLKNNAVGSLSSPHSDKSLTRPPPDGRLIFDENDAVFGYFGEQNNKSLDKEMSPAKTKSGRKRKEEWRETTSRVVNDATKESHLNENLVTSSEENLINQNFREINISQAQVSACKHSPKTHGGSRASMYEKPLKIRRSDELFGKLVSIEISDLYDNSELYVKTKQAILNVLVQAHYEKMKFNDKILQF